MYHQISSYIIYPYIYPLVESECCFTCPLHVLYLGSNSWFCIHQLQPPSAQNQDNAYALGPKLEHLWDRGPEMARD